MSATVRSWRSCPFCPQSPAQFGKPTEIGGIEHDKVQARRRERGIGLAFIEFAVRQLDVAGTDVVAHDNAGDVGREILIRPCRRNRRAAFHDQAQLHFVVEKSHGAGRTTSSVGPLSDAELLRKNTVALVPKPVSRAWLR